MKTFLKPLTASEERIFLDQLRQGEQKAKHVLIERNMRLVAHIVKKYSQTDKREEETVLADAQGEAAPYVVKELEPEIAGIIIACEGADNNVVAASVTQAAQVLFGISSNHIKVLKMEVPE